VLTTNHHGVDYFSQTFQGSLIFSLNILMGATSASTIPVFSCGNIPLNNLTYPRGVLLYHVNSPRFEMMPKKLPIFSKKFQRQMVSVTPAFNQAMIHRAKAQFDNMICHGQISPTLVRPLHKIFREDYCVSSVTALPGYSHQAVILNNRIWKRLFSKFRTVPDMVYLEQEKIVSALLKTDLSNPESLARRVMFDPALTEHVLNNLDDVRGCWKREGLKQRLHMDLLEETQKDVIKKCGTIFFWGVDHLKRRVPLYLETRLSNKAVLRGVDDHGNIWEMPYTPQAIISGLHENKLLPSNFTCFLVLSFARGIVCVGGCFQSEYLPVIQQGVVTALQDTPGYDEVAYFVAQVPTNLYIDSMLGVMTRRGDDFLIPAGPLEVLAGGGLTNEDIEKMLSLTVREAHLADMFDTILDVGLPQFLQPGWKKQLAKDCSQLLEGKIVVK
jgi:hypothetical protein